MTGTLDSATRWRLAGTALLALGAVAALVVHPMDGRRLGALVALGAVCGLLSLPRIRPLSAVAFLGVILGARAVHARFAGDGASVEWPAYVVAGAVMMLVYALPTVMRRGELPSFSD